MQTIIPDVLKLEKLLEKIDSATSNDQAEDHPLREAVSSIYDALDMLKERAGLGDDGWREAA